MRTEINVSTHLQALLVTHSKIAERKAEIVQQLSDDELTPFGRVSLIAEYNQIKKQDDLVMSSISEFMGATLEGIIP